LRGGGREEEREHLDCLGVKKRRWQPRSILSRIRTTVRVKAEPLEPEPHLFRNPNLRAQ
jgi:hypothetical protein